MNYTNLCQSVKLNCFGILPEIITKICGFNASLTVNNVRNFSLVFLAQIERVRDQHFFYKIAYSKDKCYYRKKKKRKEKNTRLLPLSD